MSILGIYGTTCFRKKSDVFTMSKKFKMHIVKQSDYEIKKLRTYIHFHIICTILWERRNIAWSYYTLYTGPTQGIGPGYDGLGPMSVEGPNFVVVVERDVSSKSFIYRGCVYKTSLWSPKHLSVQQPFTLFFLQLSRISFSRPQHFHFHTP